MDSSGFSAQGIKKPQSTLRWAGLLAPGSEKESVSKATHVGRRLHCLVRVGLKSPFSWLLALGWEVLSASRGHLHSLSHGPLHLQAGNGAPHPSHASNLSALRVSSATSWRKLSVFWAHAIMFGSPGSSKDSLSIWRSAVPCRTRE